MATVRIGDDLNDRLKRHAETRTPPVSVTQLVAEACEGLLAGTVAKTPEAKTRAARAAGPSTVSRARSQAVTGVASCSHPVGRRIGSTCMACGGATR